MKPQSCTVTYIPSLILDFNDAEMRSTTKTLGENKICTLKRSKFVHNLTHHREDAPPKNPSFCSPRSSHRFLNLDWIQVEDSDNRNRGINECESIEHSLRGEHLFSNSLRSQSNVHNVNDILVTSFLTKNLVSMLQQPHAPVNVHNSWKNGNAITSITSITSHICVHECTYTAHDQTSLTVLVFIGGVAECSTMIIKHLKVSQACKDETGQCQLLSCGEANSRE